MATRTVKLQEMTEIVSRMESNQYISGLPLAVMAKDTETLKYLHSKGIDINLLLDSASKEERIQVLFSGAIHGDAWIMKSALESAAKKGEDFLLSEDQITNLADAISRSPVDACLVATKSSYALGKNIDFLWHLLLHIIKRDRVDCLEEIISSGCVSANASIFGAPLLVVAVHSMARECFIHLLSKGAIPFYLYPSQFCQRVGFAYTNITYGPSHPLSKVSAEQKDIHFFAGCDEGSAIDLNNKASRMFLWKE
jgi:hypothetical protein